MRWNVYANVATAIPPAVVTKEWDIIGAIMDNPLPLSMDKFDRASSIDTTVPNRPINGAVEDTIDRVVNPLLATLIALPLATENMALLELILYLHMEIVGSSHQQ